MIDFHTTTNIWLSLEDYHNAGIKPDLIKKTIESINDIGAMGVGMISKLRTKPMGINNNLIVETIADDWEGVLMVVGFIEYELDDLLRRQKLLNIIGKK